MLGIIGGTALLNSTSSNYDTIYIDTPYGRVELEVSENHILLLRHQNNTPPHKINTQANIAAMIIAGVTDIVSIGSVGSLKTAIMPGNVMIPDDYISIAGNPTIFDHQIRHTAAAMDIKIHKFLKDVIPDAIDGGVYIETVGPRFETPAEIRLYACYADVVGMTVAKEATIAAEFEIPFGAVCTIDNYANGITTDEISFDTVLAHAKENMSNTLEMLSGIVESYGIIYNGSCLS